MVNIDGEASTTNNDAESCQIARPLTLVRRPLLLLNYDQTGGLCGKPAHGRVDGVRTASTFAFGAREAKEFVKIGSSVSVGAVKRFV